MVAAQLLTNEVHQPNAEVPSTGPAEPTEPLACLGARELRIAAAIAQAAMPAGRFLEGAGMATARAFDRWLASVSPEPRAALRGLLWAIEL